MKKKNVLLTSMMLFCFTAFTASAQTQFSTGNVQIIKVANSDIKALFTAPLGSKPGTMTIKVSAENGIKLAKGESFELLFPEQTGLVYDLTTLKSSNSKVKVMNAPSPAPLVIEISNLFQADEDLLLTCSLISGTKDPIKNLYVQVLKK